MWAEDGGQVIVLLEAFLDQALRQGIDLSPGQLEHARRRSLAIDCGSTQVYVSITFAAFNSGRCRNLLEDNRCAIYLRRPLVCRIYPMEINPNIPLRPEAKDCPSEAWDSGPVMIHGNTLADPELAGLIEQSRQADRDEIAAKAHICERLGFTTMALKGDGFATYLPDMAHFLDTLRTVSKPLPGSTQAWLLHIPDPDLAQEVIAKGAHTRALAPQGCAFISVRAA